MQKRDADGPGPDAEHIDAFLREVADGAEVAEPAGAAGRTPAPESGTSGVPTEPTEGAVRRLEDQLEELRDRHARLGAEFDNYRKRVTRERLEGNDRAQAQLLLKLLDSLDDLDRVVATRHEGLTADALREAVLLIERKLWKELQSAGLERVDPVGQPFDPAFHEAVSVVPAPSPEQDHAVSATFQAGYRFKGALVRPARVQVYSSEGHA
ncbi:MAG: nucleotide exchange factor GrpE [Gemmatimonadales bacterium]